MNRFTQDEPPDQLLCIQRGDQRYVFVWCDGYQAELMKTFGRFADDPELNFSWYDAAVLSMRVRKLSPNG